MKNVCQKNSFFKDYSMEKLVTYLHENFLSIYFQVQRNNFLILHFHIEYNYAIMYLLLQKNCKLKNISFPIQIKINHSDTLFVEYGVVHFLIFLSSVKI